MVPINISLITMNLILPQDYETFQIKNDSDIFLSDHLNGFDKELNNTVLQKINDSVKTKINVFLEYIADDRLKEKYPNINFIFDIGLHSKYNFFDEFRTYEDFQPFKYRPSLRYNNFICSFNGSKSDGRIMLTSALNRFGYYNDTYCSKNFTFTLAEIENIISQSQTSKDRLMLLFFDQEQNNGIGNKINNFQYDRFNHECNFHMLRPKIFTSGLHLVSETVSHSYYPIITEKFLYSVITKGLFLAYAPPGWHAQLEKYFGFKKYNKVFDYGFDSIQDPVERLMQLLTMVSKYSFMSESDWLAIYQIERETLDFNYNHYYYGKYKSTLIEKLGINCKE